MLQRDRQIKMQIQQMLDACLFGLSFWLGWGLRSNTAFTEFFNLKIVHPFDNNLWLFPVIMIAGPLMLKSQGFYDRTLLFPRRSMVLWPLFKGCLVATIVLIIVLFFVRVELARGVAVMFGMISFVMILGKEELLRRGLRSQFARAQMQRKFIIVGTEAERARIRQELNSSPHQDMVALGEVDLRTSSVNALAEMLHEHSVNGVIVNARHNYFEKVEEAIKICELEGVEVWLIADFFTPQISRTSFDDFHGRPVLVFRATPEASWQGVLKHVVDLTGAFLAMIVLALPFLLIALLIKMTSPGPILFRQKRCGLNGQPFTIFKFRTMTTDAELRKHEVAAMNEMSGPVFKMKNDPRITAFGRFLRKSSIDELPQLFNVLRGEMSLVGPRPLPVDEVKRFDDLAHRRRLSVKPGLTCLWQISGRNEVTDFKDWVRLDLEYIDNWSLWLDFKIIWRTIPIVLIGTGAR
jgi:exopolysaccharide biosynthesis polyprenyl glycosylphosphotransferase